MNENKIRIKLNRKIRLSGTYNKTQVEKHNILIRKIYLIFIYYYHLSLSVRTSSVVVVMIAMINVSNVLH